MTQEITAFFSYSRTDSEFVDRLDADLRARGFRTWVDRAKIEGGQNWKEEIEHAIVRHELFIFVMSPAAVKSDVVRYEYETALRLNKRIIPIMYLLCETPRVIQEKTIQYIQFQGRSYEMGLKELIYACQVPWLDFSTPTSVLQSQAIDLETADPERAALLYQLILDKEPNYFDGKIIHDLDRLNQRLYQQRARHLRFQAEEARKQGAYGVEAGALEALIGLGGQDAALFAWAKEYLPIAQQNRAMLGPYEVVLDCVRREQFSTARDNLTEVWRSAPYFRDPVGIAPKLGLVVPMTYEEAKARRLESGRTQQQLANLQTEHVRIAEVVSRLLRIWTSGQIEDSASNDLDSLALELGAKAPTPESHADLLLRQFVSYGKTYGKAKKDELEARSKRPYPEWLDDRYNDDYIWLVWPGIVLAIIVGAVIIYNFVHDKPPQYFVSNLIGGIVFGAIGGVLIGGAITVLVILPLILVFKSIATQLHDTKVSQLEREALHWLQEADSVSRQWQSAYARERQTRVEHIERDRDSALARIGEQFK